MPIDQPSFIDRQRKSNPTKIEISLRERILNILVTKAGVLIGGLVSTAVTAILAFLASRFGIDMTANVELTGALLLFFNQLIWGFIQWLVIRYEMPWKKELQKVLGDLKEDGVIGVMTVKRAEVVRDFADGTTPMPLPPNEQH